jgi:hypothetical protein
MKLKSGNENQLPSETLNDNNLNINKDNNNIITNINLDKE